MIGGHHEVEHAKPESLSHLKEPPNVTSPIARKFQEELPLVATMREVPDSAGQKITVGARHLFLL
jgi:hypothetical protein